jgi:hypothetical protein
MHFKSKKYDIIKMPLAKREQFLKKWNDEMINRAESLMFLKIDKLYNKDQIIRLFAYYYLEDKNFYITSVIEDEFKLFRKYESELSLIKDVIETDFYKIVYLMRKNNTKFKDILFNENGIPKIFKIYDMKIISVHTLIAIDLLWDIGNKINYESLNVVEEEKLKKYKTIFDKYVPIVYKYYDFNGKEFFKNCFKKI